METAFGSAAFASSSKKCNGSSTTGICNIHTCEIELTFPTNLQAEQVLQVLQVDREPTDRVSKSFQLIHKGNGSNVTVSKLKMLVTIDPFFLSVKIKSIFVSP